uniref:Uncharacterized protein n=1 Tax=Oryza nivara TaxID=4536 RepID=A0A0E0IRE5_ORYNI
MEWSKVQSLDGAWKQDAVLSASEESYEIMRSGMPKALQSYQGYFSMKKQSANNIGSKHRLKMRMLI